jgi:hypothetical protein
MHISTTENVRELRVAVDLAIRVFGMDSTGKPFSNPARVVEISGEGAKLKDLHCVLKVDDVVGVQFGTEKSRFRVVWVGDPNTPEQGNVGIHCVERGKCLWSAAVPQSAEEPPLGGQVKTATATASQLASPSASSSPINRRRYTRYPCTGTVQMSRPGGNPDTLKLLDLSLGGFYAETMSPFAVGTTAALEIAAQGFTVRGEGIVRTSHPSVGNGVAFTKMDEQHWRQLTELVTSLSGSGNTPHGALSSEIPAAVETLLQLLEARGVFTRAEFLQQLRQVTSRR